ncbi:MAG: hypothetical protein K8T89_21930 [Planctomycetes bacterium]|nr:hypothetical protein [Planctomycetota bacterium]
MNDQQNSDTPESQQPRPGGFLTLPVILVIGWLIYEGTHEPAIAAMAMCLKFGLEDFRTARWLLRTDPDGGRGRSCAWLYIASGLWQTAVIGLAMVLLTVVLDELIQGRPQKPKDAVGLRKLLNGATLTILFGFTFSTLATYVAMLYAWRHRVRPWLNGSVHYARKQVSDPS